MAAHRLHPPAPRRRRSAPTGESGFSLIEMMIVVAITAILLAALANHFLGAKKATYAAEAKAAGSAYAQAISQYQADHANRNPPTMTNTGPLDLLQKPYMRSAPDGVAGGRIVFSPACAAPGGTALGWVAYCTGGPHGTEPGFGIRVQWRGTSSEPWNPGCWTGRTGATPRC